MAQHRPVNQRHGDLQARFRQWKGENLELAGQNGNGIGYFPIFSGIQHYLPRMNGHDLEVYLVLACHANNDTGDTFITVERIAEIIGKSVSAVNRSMASLSKMKLIERVRRGLGQSSYTILRPYTTEWKGADLSKSAGHPF